MKKFLLDIYTPKGIYFRGEVEELYLKTSAGYRGILAKHDRLITGVEIAPGFIIKDNKKEYYAFFAGILNIERDSVKLIVNNIEHADSIDINRAKNAKNRAEELLKNKSEGVDIKRAELALKRALARVGSVEKNFL